MLHLVRHGRPLAVPGVPAHEWSLDPSAHDLVVDLRASGRLPMDGAWFTSPEPKAVQTAALLHDGPVPVVDDLREHVRHSTDWIDPFEPVLRRAFADPGRPAHPGWEPLDDCRSRVTRAVAALLRAHPHQEVVLVGHATAWTLVAAVSAGTDPDLARWRTLGMPDVIVLPPHLPSAP